MSVLVPPQEIRQGDTWEVQVGYFEPKPGTPPDRPPVPDLDNPVDLTGWSAKLQVKKRAGQPAALSLTSDSGGGLTVNGVDGTIDVWATPTQMEGIAPGQWLWEVQIERVVGATVVDRRTIASEPLVILAQVTT